MLGLQPRRSLTEAQRRRPKLTSMGAREAWESPFVITLVVVTLGLMTLGGSCDRTRIRATVSPSKVSTAPGRSVRLELKVAPEVQENTHREDWVVEPESLGRLIYDSTPGNARIATFEALAPGRGTISVHAFYRPQTSPQLVAEIPVSVVAKAGQPVPKPVVQFCERFKREIPGCWCAGPAEQSRVAETLTAVPDSKSAEALVVKHHAGVAVAQSKRAGKALEIKSGKPSCVEVREGFFSCGFEEGFSVTISSCGEIYLTDCGV